jgi:hypothetical protein
MFPSDIMLRLCCIISVLLTLFFNIVGYKTTHTAVMDKSNSLDILVVFNRSLNHIIFFIFFFSIFSRKMIKKKTKFFCFFNICIHILFLLVSGSRGSAILTLFLIPYLYVLFSKKVPLKFIIISVAYLIIIVPISLVYRQMDLFKNLNNRDIWSKVTAITKAIQDVDFTIDTVGFVFQYAFGRISLFQHNLRIIQYMPEIVPYTYGKTIFPHTIISMLPTFIVPKRPLTNIGKWFGVTFGFTGGDNPSFITAGIFNELYINFSFFGIFFVFIISIIIKRMYFFWKENKTSLLVNILFYNFFIQFCYGFNESYIASGINTFIKDSVFTLFILLGIYLIDNNKKKLEWGGSLIL